MTYILPPHSFMDATHSENTKRIAKNTFVLYVRMFFLMALSLYTSRVVLDALGIQDYGIYNVVGGVVAMFGFLNSALSTSTTRYITFELEKGDAESQRKIFSLTLITHAIIAIIVFLLSETIGLWFFFQKMVIPFERLSAAFWVLQLSIVSSVVMIMSVPYNAVIIAHERISAFAYISVYDSVARLGICFLIMQNIVDRLVLYGVLIFILQMSVRYIYGRYCARHFSETRFCFVWDKKLLKEMFSFATWNLWGNCAGVAINTGANLMANTFFGPFVNAARGVAGQVNGVIMQFAGNFQVALNPQIIKSYAANDLRRMHALVFSSSKFTFLVLFLIALPVMLEAPYLLGLWLKEVPEYAVAFTRVMFCISIMDASSSAFMTSAAASGKVKRYQTVLGGIALLYLPIAYVVLVLGGDPVSMFWVHMFISYVNCVVRLNLVKPLIHLSITEFVHKVVLPCMVVAMVSVVPPFLVMLYMESSFLRLVVVGIVSVFFTLLAIFLLGLSNSERTFIYERAKAVCLRLKNTL